jgi:hypothetical protein
MTAACQDQLAAALLGLAANFLLLTFLTLLGMACIKSPKSLAGCGLVFNVLPAPPVFASRVEHES